MADSGKNAITTYSGNGSTTDFNVGFLFIEQSHIQVVVDGVTKTLTTDYSVNTVTQQIEFGSAPANGSNNIVFTRVTPSAALVSFSDGAGVDDASLTKAFLQGQYRTEEVEDKI